MLESNTNSSLLGMLTVSHFLFPYGISHESQFDVRFKTDYHHEYFPAEKANVHNHTGAKHNF